MASSPPAQFRTVSTQAQKTVEIFSSVDWTYVTVRSRSAGPIVIGNLQELGPVQQGKGVILPTSADDTSFLMPPGDKLYVYADTNELLTVIIVALPFLSGLQALGKLAGGGAGKAGC